MTTSPSPLKERIVADMKAAMKAGDKSRLGAIRLILAAIKQREVDERTSLDDTQTLLVLDKMVKQRRESISLYDQAGRSDLADAERAELAVLQDYLPQALSDAEIAQAITAAIEETGASGAADMGKVMAALRPKIQGRADMAQVSSQVRGRLAR